MDDVILHLALDRAIQKITHLQWKSAQPSHRDLKGQQPLVDIKHFDRRTIRMHGLQIFFADVLMRDGHQVHFMMLAQHADLVKSSQLVSLLDRVRKTGCDERDPQVRGIISQDGQ